jgi:hypothetical protein
VTDTDHTTELLDEVLQQASQQALRMSHLDESVAELKDNVAALRGELAMAPAMQQQGGARLQSAEQIIGEKVDAIERDAHAAKTKVTVLTALAAVQTLLLSALVFLALRPMAPPPAPPVEAAAPAQKPVQVAVEKPIEQNPFAGAAGAPAGSPTSAADAAKTPGNDDAMKDAKAESKAKKKGKKK